MNVTFSNAKNPSVNIPNKSLKEFIQMVEEYYKMTITKKQVLALIKLRTGILMLLLDHSFWDTAHRELVGDVLAEYITDEAFSWWPVNGDLETHKVKFLKALILGCAEKKIPNKYKI